MSAGQDYVRQASEFFQARRSGGRDLQPRRCTASRFGDHDYSLPPHNTPEEPVSDMADDVPCWAQSANQEPWCQHERRYEVVMYQIATHEWVRLFACVPCVAALRRRHKKLGPRGTDGIVAIREIRTEPPP